MLAAAGCAQLQDKQEVVQELMTQSHQTAHCRKVADLEGTGVSMKSEVNLDSWMTSLFRD